MRRKKAVKIAIYISAASLFLSGTVVSPTYASEGVQGLTETEAGQKEEKNMEEMKAAAGDGKETQAESPSADKDTEPEGPSADKDAEPDSPVADKDTEPDSSVEQDVKFSGTTDDKSDDITEKDDGKAADEEKASEENAEGAEAESTAVRLEVPQKFDIVLDPWEMDGKGQIYSEEYTIKNISGEKGTLTLTCIADGEDVDIQPDDSSIYDGDGRNLFIEMVVNDEDRLALLPEGADYEVMLEADESVTFTFTGKMNETAEAGWRGSDVKVMIIYDWAEEPGEDIREEEKKDPGKEKNLNTDALAEKGKDKEDTSDTGMLAEDNKGEDPDADKLAEDVGVKGDAPDADTPTEGSKEEGDTPDTGMLAEDNKGEDPDVDKPTENVSEKGDTSDADTPAEDSKEEEKDPNVSRPAEDDEEGKAPNADTPVEGGNEEGKAPGVDIPTEDNQEEGNASGTDTLTDVCGKTPGVGLPEENGTKEISTEEKGGNEE